MDFLLSIINSYFDIIFVRQPDSGILTAMTATAFSFLLLYLVFPVSLYYMTYNKYIDRHVNTRAPGSTQISREVSMSMVSILMFSLLNGLSAWLLVSGYYSVSGSVSISRWIIEILILYAWNEVHFYICHRALHWKPLYKRVHKEHHSSITVTPLSSWRFHWFEALLLGSVMPLAIAVHEFSVWSLAMLPVISLFWNTVGHSNLDSIGNSRLMTTASVRHALHHSRFNGNYGFSLPFLDKAFSTEITGK